MAQLRAAINSRFDNLLTIDPTQFTTNDLPHRLDFFLRKRTQQLCQGTYEKPAILEKDLKCLWLHHHNPYLKLGPFKFELRHVHPEIAEVDLL